MNLSIKINRVHLTFRTSFAQYHVRRHHNMPAPPRHVLIVGGGLAGPCLALALARQNIRSTIFEIRSSRSIAGGSISLAPNALYILDRYAGVYEDIKAHGHTYRRIAAYAEDGEKFGEIAVSEEEKGEEAYPAVRIMRSDIHNVLMDAGERMQDKLITVRYGARLSKIEESAHGVTATFEDGSTAEGKS